MQFESEIVEDCDCKAMLHFKIPLKSLASLFPKKTFYCPLSRKISKLLIFV